MKFVIALSFVLAVAAAASTGNDKDAAVVKSEFDNIGVDGYHYGYETSNGISANEHGSLVNPGAENEHIAVQGEYTFTGEDGVKYSVQYIADENGYQPEGAHLPHA